MPALSEIPSTLPADAVVAHVAASQVARVLERLGRTEDVRFSPSNRRLAIAGFHQNTCALLDIEMDLTGARPVVHLKDVLTLRSPAIEEPHGFDFVDDDTLVVANRGAAVAVFALPAAPGAGRLVDLSPIADVRWADRDRPLHSPGSACVVRRGRLSYELLVCNNYRHLVSRHVVPRRRWLGRPHDNVLLKHGLDVPDGITVSRDGTWLAVSNHATHEVFIYDRRRALGPQSAPDAVLSGVGYPHGLRFSPDSTRLWVADAGAPCIVLFEDPSGGWRGRISPAAAFSVLDDATFLAGRGNPEEGGPKGIDLDASGEILAVTNERQPLAFFRTRALIDAGRH